MKLTVHVQPNAKENKIVEWLDNKNVKIKIAAPAQQGRANQALIEFLSKKLGLAKSEIEINWGLTGRVKQISLPLPEKQVRTSLE